MTQGPAQAHGTEAERSAASYVSDGMPPLDQFADAVPCVVTLPLYPFDELSYWLTGPGAQSRALAPAPGTVAAGVGANRQPLPTACGQDGALTPADTLRACVNAVAIALGYDDVQPEDSFIGLGGSSLAALQVQSRLLGEHGLEVSMEQILAADDLHALAELIDAANAPSE